jgi:hypothetical protein
MTAPVYFSTSSRENVTSSIYSDRLFETKIGKIDTWQIDLIGREILHQLLPILVSKDKNFPSENIRERFSRILLWHIKEAIVKSFATPLGFLRDGLSFQLSANEPTEMVKRIAQVVALDINLFHVPAHYRIALHIDALLSQEQSELVFSLTESSENIELSKRTFTIESLEQKFHQRLSKL